MDEPRRSDDAAGADAAGAETPEARGFAHTIACPECGHTYEHEGRLTTGFLQCPACAAQFFAPDTSVREDGDEQRESDQPDEGHEAALKRQEDLHYLRIRQAVLTERRALARTRTWYIVGTAGFAVAAVQMLVLAYKYVYVSGAGWRLRPIGYVFAALTAALAAVIWFRRIRAINEDLRRPVLDEPTTPPDFSTLSDGSERWKNLEAMHERARASEWRS
jgi:hypothetical protein